MDLMIFKPVVNKVVGRLLIKPEDVEDFKQEAYLKICEVAKKLPIDETEAKKSNWKNFIYTCILNRLITVSNKNRARYWGDKNLQKVSRKVKRTEEFLDDFRQISESFTPVEREILGLQTSPSPEYMEFLKSYRDPDDCRGFSFAIQKYLKLSREEFITEVKSLYRKASRFKMLTDGEIKAKPQCFGEMYDDLVGVCKEACSLREECKIAVMQKLQSVKIKNKISKETKQTWRHLMSHSTLELSRFCNLSKYDSLTQEIMTNFYDFGFMPMFSKNYVSFRIGEKRIFSLVNKSVVNGLGECLISVAIRRKEFFPGSLQAYVSDKVEGIFPYLSFQSIEDLREFLSGFVREFLIDEEVDNDCAREFSERGVEG